MINEPAIDKLITQVGNRYALTVVVAKRARQIVEQPMAFGKLAKEKPITQAAMEVYNGKLTYTKD